MMSGPSRPAGGPPIRERDMTETVLQSAVDVAGMVRRKEISSRELTGMLLARIDEVDPGLNAVVELRRAAALREAAVADEALAHGVPGPLHGVPMTIKESFNVTGMHTTWGNPAFKDYVAEWDATVVRRLRRAGSVLVGSIRIPASFCGVYGLKPSVGTVPLTGFQPPGPPGGPSDMTYMSAVGPLGRSAGDLRAALTVTAGPEAPAAEAYSWTLPQPRHVRLADFRVGVVFDHARAPVSSEVGTLLADAVDALRRAGATVVEGWPDGVDPVRQYESFGYHVQLFFAFQQPGGQSGDLTEYIEHENRRMAARAAWRRYFDDIDVFLCPANFTPAFPHDSRPFDARTIATPEGERPYEDQAFWVSHASLPGLPAVVAPIGRTAGGLPVGVQIIGPLFADDTAITFAERLADLVGGYEPPPVG